MSRKPSLKISRCAIRDQNILFKNCFILDQVSLILIFRRYFGTTVYIYVFH